MGEEVKWERGAKMGGKKKQAARKWPRFWVLMQLNQQNKGLFCPLFCWNE